MRRIATEIPHQETRTAVLGEFLKQFAGLTSDGPLDNKHYAVASASFDVGFAHGGVQNSGKGVLER